MGNLMLYKDLLGSDEIVDHFPVSFIFFLHDSYNQFYNISMFFC